jgi:hypothetical protein
MVSRGRSTSRSARGAKRAASRSISVTSSRSGGSGRKWGKSGVDGFARRGWVNPMAMSTYFDPFPRTMRAVLRYSETVNLDASALSPAHYIFRAGSIFDPNYTGVGHQPYGHDIYERIFNHYRVVKSVCKITNASGGANNIMGLTLTDDVSVQTDYDTLREVKPTKFIPLCGTSDGHTLILEYNSAQAFPRQGQATTALFGSNPAEDMYFDIWTQGNLTTNNPSALAVAVCIEYYVEFSELKDLGLS